MSVDELLQAVKSLSEPDLNSFVDRALWVRASRRAPVSTPAETALLRTINQPIPLALQARYNTLADKRDDEVLTDSEHLELLDIAHQIERFSVKRLTALTQLAAIRQVPLLKLMDELEIQTPSLR